MAGRSSWLNLILMCLLLAGAVSATTELEGFDEIEDEAPVDASQRVTQGLKHEPAPSAAADAAAEAAPATAAEAVPAAAAANQTAAKRPLFNFGDRKFPKDFVLEIFAILFLVGYGFNVFVGRKANDAVAIAWATQFCSDGAVLDRNFSLIGPGDTGSGEVLIRQSYHAFIFHASGRRFCRSLSATLELKRRQDLVSLAWYLVQARNDFIDLEVAMNEGAMPPMVLFIGQPRFAKARLAEERDLQKFTKKVEVPRDRIAAWPGSKQLVVLAEHSSLLYDLMTDAMISQVFGSVAFETARKYFRFLHFTTEDDRARSPRVLRFSFNLPPKEQMGELTSLMTALCAFIDIVGSYQLTPEAKKRAEKKRQEVAAEEAKGQSDDTPDHLEELRKRKQVEEQEKLRRMTPAQREKYMEKRKAVLQKRQMKMKMIK